MSNIFPLKLIGAGSRYIECAASYTVRIANCHGVSPSDLYRIINIHLLANKKYSLMHSTSKPLPALSSLNCYNKWAVKSHKAISFLCNENYANRSFLHFPFPNTTNILRLKSTNLKWCPLCLREDIQSSSPPYLRLLWQIDDIPCCDKHWVNLERVCPHCLKHQDQVNLYWPDITKCKHCNKSLLDYVRHTSRIIIGKFYWGYCDLVEILSEGKEFDWETIRSTIDSALISKFGSYKKVESSPQVSYKESALLHRFLFYERPITMNSIFQLCDLVGISVWDAINGCYELRQLPLNIPNDNHYLSARGYNKIPHQAPGATSYRQFIRLENTRLRASDIINNSTPPPTLRELSQTCGVSIKTIKDKWPSLFYLAKKRREDYIQSKKIRQKIEAHLVCFKIIKELKQDNRYPTATRIANEATKHAEIPHSRLYEAAKEIISYSPDRYLMKSPTQSN